MPVFDREECWKMIRRNYHLSSLGGMAGGIIEFCPVDLRPSLLARIANWSRSA
jgi:hypothetical protein